jgi:hypothetical protein
VPIGHRRGRNSDPLPIIFDTSGKSPAYLHHRKSFESPRRETGRGLFHWGFFESDGSRGRTILPESASRKASRRAAVRALFTRRAEMTAYLISLSLLGLVAIAVWDGFS